jgi:hypothetical protein
MEFIGLIVATIWVPVGGLLLVALIQRERRFKYMIREYVKYNYAKTNIYRQ